MRLSPDEQAMLDGKQGIARQKAMELLVRYGEALGAERFVDTNNVAGVPGSSSLFLHNYYRQTRGDASYETIFSLYDLDSDVVFPVPPAHAPTSHLQGGVDPRLYTIQGMSRQAAEHQLDDETAVLDRGIKLLKTCTPYLAGNMPVRGEHCAWMESSAVVFCNSFIGARTNTEGRESTSAAMLTGKIPDWGLHRAEHRYGTHLVEVDVPVNSMNSMMDWGMLGYFVGQAVGEGIPVMVGSLGGSLGHAELNRHKHFGAAAASSGGVELYHIAGMTPEAPTLEAAFGPRRPLDTIRYGPAERRATYETLNANGRSRDVDYVMLGCPHAALEQLREAAFLLDGKRVRTHLWMFTSRAVKKIADESGFTEAIEAAGGYVMTDTCSAIGRILPKGTKVVALDSAKQVHYLPAIMDVEAWFGTTEDCVRAAITGKWTGELK